MLNQGIGLSKFISNPSAITKAMGIPASQQTVDVNATDVTSRPKVAPVAQPTQNLVPDPVAAMGVDPVTGQYLSKEDRIRKFKERKALRAMGIDPDLPQAGEISKVDKLEDAGIGDDQVKRKVKDTLDDEFKMDPKMKKAFMDALALPVKSAAVAITDLLEKIPAPSREASKILNRNINKISDAFNLGAASTEVANDEADNDNKSKKGTVIGGLLSKIFNLFTRKKSGGNTGGASDNGSSSGSGDSSAIVTQGDATEGRRAPYTGTADGIGLGDGRVSRSSQNKTGKPRSSMTMNATTVFGGRGNTMSTGPSNFVELSSMNANPLVSNSSAAYAARTRDMVPRNIVQKLAEKRAEAMKRVSNKEPVTNLTELTDKTIQENRDSADQKTQKPVSIAKGTSDAIAPPSVTPYQQEGGELAQPKIKKSKYIGVYNTTSQF